MNIPPHASKPRIRPRDVVAHAEYFAGFTERLTTWTLAIAADGRLIQHVKQLLPDPLGSNRERDFEVTLDGRELDAIIEVVVSVRFTELASNYASNADDQEYMTLNVLGKSVKTYGAGWILMYEEAPVAEVNRFLQVWNEVHRHAPFLDEHPPIPPA